MSIILMNTLFWPPSPLTVVFAVLVVILATITVFRMRAIKLYRNMVFLDDLTELKKSTYLEQYFADSLPDFDSDVSMYYLNIDNFKNYNDLFGINLTNRLLFKFARRLEELSAPYKHVYRVHSDRFILLHPKQEREAFTNRLLARLKEPFEVDDYEIRLTVSGGRYDLPEKRPRYYECVFRSELALQEAKTGGKDRIVAYSSEMRRENQDSFRMFQSIKDALKNELFYLEFQPIVDLSTEKPVGLESLIRIQDKYKIHFPSDIIQYAERYNMIEDIDRYVVDKSLQGFKQILEADVPIEFLSINISSKEIYNPTFIDYLAAKTKEYGLDPKRIVIEFTETTDPRGLEEETTFIGKLRAKNYNVAIDDFGTGYSSLMRLSKNQIDRIKIDRMFIHNIATDKNNRALVETMVKLAEKFGIATIVEGIELPEDYEIIKKMPVQFAQGYLFHRPMRLAAVFEKFSTKQDSTQT